MQSGSVTLAKARFDQPGWRSTAFRLRYTSPPGQTRPLLTCQSQARFPSCHHTKLGAFCLTFAARQAFGAFAFPSKGPVPMHSRTVSSIFPFSEKGPRLTAEEWMLILQAMSAYQHHESYRALYEKLRAELPLLTKAET